MIPNYLERTVLPVVAGIALFASPAAEAAPVTYSDGDLFLGFRAIGGTGATQTYLINIGQASTYRNALPNVTLNLSLGTIATDLTAIYGATWFTRSDILWGVVGVQSVAGNGDLANTLYASKVTFVPGLALPWARRSSSQQGTTGSTVQSMVSGYINDPEGSTANSTLGVIQNTSDVNNWSNFNPGGSVTSSFGAYTPSIEGSSATGIGNAPLDLFRLVRTGVDDGSGFTTGNGSYEGTFQIAGNGQVTFNVVPEPSAAVLLGLGASVLGWTRRRRPSVTA
jgi:hypothetical protein